MNNPTPGGVPESEARPRSLAWLLLLGLLILRIPWLAGARWIFDLTGSDWVQPVFEVGTFVLIAAFIWFERARLAAYHIDRLALVIIIVGKPIEWLMYRLHIPFTWPERSSLYLLNLPVAIALAIALVAARPRMPHVRWRGWLWAVLGVLAGGALGEASEST